MKRRLHSVLIVGVFLVGLLVGPAWQFGTSASAAEATTQVETPSPEQTEPPAASPETATI